MQSSRRIAWVDYAKGIAIIGVFILHSNAPEGVIHVVDAFCMPLFFLLSGFVFFNPQVFLVPVFPVEQATDADFPGNILRSHTVRHRTRHRNVFRQSMDGKGLC